MAWRSLLLHFYSFIVSADKLVIKVYGGWGKLELQGESREPEEFSSTIILKIVRFS